jgi:hypothetical protein
MGGTKSNNRGKAKKKSSGPKGKKARAKSKLDRVWGESYDVDKRDASRVRIGRSRLLVPPTANPTKDAAGGGTRWTPALPPPIVEDGRRRASSSSSHSNDGGGIGSNGRTRTRGCDRGGRAEDTDTEDDEDDDDEEEGVDGGGGMGGMGSSPLSTLLRRIGDTRMARYEDDGEDDDEMDEDDGSSPDNDAYDDVDEDDDDDKCDVRDIAGRIDSSSGIVVALTAATTDASSPATCEVDPYDAHFSRVVASSPNVGQSSSLDATAKSSTNIPPSIVRSCQSSGTMEISLSGRLLAAWEDHARVAIADYGTWEGFARGPYRHVRKVLSGNWDVVNKSLLTTSSPVRQRHRLLQRQLPNQDVGPNVDDHLRDIMTPLQMAIYPAISRYADVLITSETRRVSARERG